MDYAMIIGGREVRTNNRRSVRLPYDGSEVAAIFEAGQAEVDAAIAAAADAFPITREMSREERSAILRKAHYRLMDQKEDMALTIASESGKPLKEARTEVDRAAYTLLFSSEEAHRLAGEVIPMDAHPAGKGHMGFMTREPLGVIAAITPFNFPLNLSMHKIGPAIAAGNTVVHKPASTTPICALKMAAILNQCGLPAGALNVITGPGGAIGEQLVFDRRIAMVTFTGSADVGLRIRNLAGMKRVTLELGNNSAVIVEDDADLDEAAARCVTGAFAHSGQVCISVQRIFVNQALRDAFVERFVDSTAKLKPGHPHSPDTDVSSLITSAEAERVEGWIQEAVASGARRLRGGSRKSAIMEPAVLTDVPPAANLACREAFGPVVGINSYSSLQEAIEAVNASEYGLQAAIYTRDIRKAFDAARQVHVGGFMINEVPQFRVDQMPYGGVKMSGTGREGPRYAIEEMTEPKLVVWKT